MENFTKFLNENADFGSGIEGVLVSDEKKVTILMIAREMAIMI